MKPADYPSDLKYDEIMRMLGEHAWSPEIEEAKILAREDLLNMERIGKITREERFRLQSLLDAPREAEHFASLPN